MDPFALPLHVADFSTTGRVAVGAVAGLVATVAMNVPMHRLPEGSTPPFVAAGALTGEGPADVDPVLASGTHYAAGVLGGGSTPSSRSSPRGCTRPTCTSSAPASRSSRTSSPSSPRSPSSSRSSRTSCSRGSAARCTSARGSSGATGPSRRPSTRSRSPSSCRCCSRTSEESPPDTFPGWGRGARAADGRRCENYYYLAAQRSV
ncbi:hypothetical protein [Halosegnis marinus]|uniref:hypothetical protein n=1 Tax=Halosegnis marinus TaxID=3034023 RepID=UPI0036098610